MGLLFKFLLVFLFFSCVCVYSQETSKTTYIGIFKSFQSSENPEISEKIQEEFILQGKEINFLKGNSTSTAQSLQEAKKSKASFLVDGYYKKKIIPT